MKRVTVFFLFIFLLGSSVMAEDMGSRILDHVSDGDSWSPVPGIPAIKLGGVRIGDVKIPFTRHVSMLLISGAILTAIGIAVGFSSDIIPCGITAFVEPVVLFIRDSVLVPMFGEQDGGRWLNFFATLFFFILLTNGIGLLPFFSTATSNINVTLGLAAIIFFLVFSAGFLKFGPFAFFTNMCPHGVPKLIGIFIVLIEALGLFIKNFVLAIRLFANMLAGHFVIISLLALIFIVHPLALFVSVPLAVFITLLEVLVVVIQAFVFTLLSAIFISSAVSEH